MFDPTTESFQQLLNLMTNRRFTDHDSDMENKSKNERRGMDYLRKLEEFLEDDDDSMLPHKNSEKSTEARKDGNKLYGSKNHDQEVHAKILTLYTKSIALAKENSEELALGYGNRSALLFHLQKYKECLIDIDRACKITKSDELKKKLATRKQDCLLQLKKVKTDEENPPKFKFTPSKEISCASELIKLDHNQKYGRHVVAAQDIQPGTVIAVEKSFVLFPEMDNFHLNCSHCLLLAWNGIPCHNCSVAVYCSEKCKEEAWQQYHDIECSILPYLDYLDNYYRGCTITLPLALRVFIKAIKMEGLINIINEADNLERNKNKTLDQFFHNDVFQSNKFQSIYNLANSQECVVEHFVICKCILRLLCKKSKIFHDMVDDAKSKIVEQDVLSCIYKIFERLKNITSITSYTFETYNKINKSKEMKFGAMFCSFSGLFNHSCVNNVERLYTKNHEMILYTLNFVPKGQQLFVNYGGTYSMVKEERQNFLKRYYNFVCDCQACSENWPCLSAVEKEVNEQDTLNVLSVITQKYEKTRVLSTFYSIVQGDEWVFTKYSLEDTAKIINLLYKHYTGRKGFGIAYCFVCYMINYFNNFYSIRYDIPVNC